MNKSITDSRLKLAYKLLQKGTISLLSIDIFDTLIWRKLPTPADLFLLLGKKLKHENWLKEAICAENFPALRSQAEQLARLKKANLQGNETAEVTLREIYWCMHGLFHQITIEEMVEGKKGLIDESDVDDLVNLEVAFEKQCVQLDWNIVQLIHEAQSKQVPVVLVSNTYFDTAQLEQFLDRPDPITSNPFLPQINKIYPSCEYGVSKQDGLFKYLLQDYSVEPKQVLHVGDHPEYDMQVPCAIGMHAVHYPKFSDQLLQVIEREWPQNDLKSRTQWLDPTEGDFGLTTMRSQLEHQEIDLNKVDAFLWRYGATVLGPILTGFIHWIYTRCQMMQATQPLCLMREGRFYAQLIQNYSSYFPQHQLEPKELWVSRRFLTFACIFQATKEELFSLIYRHPAVPYTVGSFCAELNVDIQKDKKIGKYANVRLDSLFIESEQLREDLVHILSTNDSYRERMMIQAADRRHRYLKYLSTVVDLSTSKALTLVDVGWVGTTQAALQAILAIEGYRIPVHGLYLGTEANTQLAMLQGSMREGYLLKAGFPHGATKAIKRGRYALEQVATPDCGPMLDVDSQGNVVTGKLKTSQRQRKQAQKVRDGIFACLDHLGKHIQAGEIGWNSFSESLQEQLRGMLVRAAVFPTLEEAEYLGQWSHDIASGPSDVHALGSDSYYENFVGDLFPQGIVQDQQIPWPAAHLAKYDVYAEMAAQTMLTEQLPVQSFLSHNTHQLELFVDHGKGFSKKSLQTVAVHSNANGSFFADIPFWSLEKPIKKIRLQLIAPETLIHIKTLRLSLYTQSNPDVQELIFFEKGSNNKLIKCSADHKVNSATFFIKDNPLSLTIDTAKKDVYAVRILFCFK